MLDSGSERPAHDRRVDVATRLLRQALDDGWLPPEALARALHVSENQLALFRAREAPMGAEVRYALAEALREVAPPTYRVYVRSVRAQAVADRAIDEARRR
jgi:hypothetical protein